MNRFALVLGLLAFVATAWLAVPTAFSQVCNYVDLNSQAEVDAFDCVEVRGDLTISGVDITDLSPLSGLTTVGESDAGGNLIIRDNPSLTSLAGLESLSIVGGVNNPPGACGGGAYIINNSALLSLEGLEGLTLIRGELVIRSNASLTSLTGLEGLEELYCNLIIWDNAALTSLAGLGDATNFGGIRIWDNTALTSLAGLESVTSLIALGISGNAALTSLTGLDGLTSLGSLHIQDNNALTSLAGLEGVTSLSRQGGGLSIRFNASLTSLAGLENLTTVFEMEIEGNAALESLTGLESITSTVSNIGISGTQLTSLAGLSGLTSIGGALRISHNSALGSVEGLSSLTSVGGRGCCDGLYIHNNDALSSLVGLENLADIDGFLDITDNAALSACACGLAGLISGDPPAFTGINGEVTIEANAPNGLCTSPGVVLSTPCIQVASETSAEVPDRCVLTAPYPNPVRNIATVSFAVPVATHVRVAVFDVLGREVAVLTDGVQPDGVHEALLDSSRLAPGLYIVRLQVGKESATHNFTVLR